MTDQSEESVNDILNEINANAEPFEETEFEQTEPTGQMEADSAKPPAVPEFAGACLDA